MYQALYRKWRPRTFDDVVGQPHITETLKQQVCAGRLSHAYLFTGTRGTGKTSCAKILARAANCHAPEEGNPCNRCSACLGIENGSVLDVLELDAASNNGVDHVRALRDEAIYTPAAVQKRVYIVDEVHMLSTPAFNALLKILEEPPPHLMFILATTELQKVPATIRSRCQQFSFKRILPAQIARHLAFIAGEEGLALTPEAAGLLARLSDGGLRDALSLLDQCSGTSRSIDEGQVLDTLGLAGNVETAALMGHVAQRNTAGALETLARLYSGGKEMGSLLGELSSLARDLLLRKTAPLGAAALMAGGYDEGTLRALGEQFTPQRLLYLLTLLQEVTSALPRSSNRRTDGELCLMRMCDEGMEDSVSALSARLARLEAGYPLPSASNAVPVGRKPAAPAAPSQVPASPAAALHQPCPPPDDPPPWEAGAEEVPAPVQTRRRAPASTAKLPQAPAAKSSQASAGDVSFWPAFAASLKGKVPPSLGPYLSNPAKVTGTWAPGVLTLWADSSFTRAMLDKPALTGPLLQAAEQHFGQPARIAFQVGAPAAGSDAAPLSPPPPLPQSAAEEPWTEQWAPEGGVAESDAPAQQDALDDLLMFGEQFDNIVIQ